MFKGIHLVSVFSIIFASPFVEAYPKTQKDFSMLPKYCYARMRGTEAESAIWENRFGRKSYIHLHHYCSGLDYLNKANLTVDKKARTINLTKAIKQFNYIGQHAPTTFSLMPENYYNLGKAKKLMKDISGALESFQRSIKLNKKYTRAYAAISDIYVDSGNKVEALKIIQQGLKVTPKSKALKRRLNELK